MAKARLGVRSTEVKWIAADVTTWEPPQLYEVWHDRAAFHFLVDPKDRAECRAGVASCTSRRACDHRDVSLHGPERCSGLPVVRSMPLHSVRYWATRSICRRAVPTPIERLWGQSSRSNSPAFGVLFEKGDIVSRENVKITVRSVLPYSDSNFLILIV